MIACTSPAAIVRSTPLTIGVPSSRATCRFFSSSVAMEFATPEGLPNRPRGPSVRASNRSREKVSGREGAGGRERWYAHAMGNIGAPEIILLLLVALLLFGAKRLPEIGRSLGSGMREFKDSVSGTTRPEATQT